MGIKSPSSSKSTSSDFLPALSMGSLEFKTGLHKPEQLGLSINPEPGGEPPPARKRSKALLRCGSGAGSKPQARRHLVPSFRTTNEKLS